MTVTFYKELRIFYKNILFVSSVSISGFRMVRVAVLFFLVDLKDCIKRNTLVFQYKKYFV